MEEGKERQKDRETEGERQRETETEMQRWEDAQTYCQDIMDIEISCFLQLKDVQQILKIKVR